MGILTVLTFLFVAAILACIVIMLVWYRVDKPKSADIDEIKVLNQNLKVVYELWLKKEGIKKETVEAIVPQKPKQDILFEQKPKPKTTTKIRTPEEKKAFGARMLAARLAKKNTKPSEPNQPEVKQEVEVAQ